MDRVYNYARKHGCKQTLQTAGSCVHHTDHHANEEFSPNDRQRRIEKEHLITRELRLSRIPVTYHLYYIDLHQFYVIFQNYFAFFLPYIHGIGA